MNYEASRTLGLKLYGNEQLQTKIANIMGMEFVEECIQAAITICPPEGNSHTDKGHTYAYRFKRKPK